MKKFAIFLTVFCSLSIVFAQTPITLQKELIWQSTPVIHNPTGNFATEIWRFDGASFTPNHPSLPLFSERFALNSNRKISVEVIAANFEKLERKPDAYDSFLSDELMINTSVEQDRQQYFGHLFFIPIIKNGNGQYEKVVSFTLKITSRPETVAPTRDPTYTFNSVLSDGTIYKIAVNQNGVHKLDYNFLKNDLGINIDNIDPRKIQLFGNGGGMLPEKLSTFRYDDLEENAIKIVGEDDGSFDASDYILFYGEGANEQVFDSIDNVFRYVKNVYDDNTYYFIKIADENGLRISSQASVSNTNYTTTSFDAFKYYHEDQTNLLYAFQSAQGSGRQWFGDIFSAVRDRSYNNIFSFPNIISDEGNKVKMKIAFAARNSLSSTYTAKVNGQSFTKNIPNVLTGNVEAPYARIGLIEESFVASSSNLDVNITYPIVGNGTNTGWLDYIEMNARRQLSLVSSQLLFQDIQSIGLGNITQFKVAGANGNTTIWDISDPLKPKQQNASLDNSQLSFGVATDVLKYFVAFNDDANLLTATAVGAVDNQNIHSIEDVDFVILYHPDFESAATQLAEHRTNHSNMNVAAVRINQLYNEFASGAKDITAIRDFAKMVYDRSVETNPSNPRFKYLLLMGDGSFDYKNILDLETNQTHNFIPAYETAQSLDPIRAFPSDDYFALLSNSEGENLFGALDIAIGRIPVRTATEAQGVVNKIINYDTNPETLGDWRIRLAYVGDDEDGGTHFRQANEIATKIDTLYPLYNSDKIFLDAHKQVATPGGERYPTVEDAINTNMFKGVLAVNYLGHGGSTGWAQERILKNSDILNWSNINKPPLFVTATCSFTGYDEPNYTTAGELSFLNPNGGAIGLLTTVRAVYSSSNERLTKAVFNTLFEKVDDEYTTIGELLRLAKNSNGQDTVNINARKFALIGDPSQTLAFPEHNVITTKINGNVLSTATLDTIRALDKVTIEGMVVDQNGTPLSDFNGKVFPTIYDKKITLSTLGQDDGSPVRPFTLQKNIIFKGVASVTNGKFEFTFVVPKDINYEYGKGKISYYAHDGVSSDAAGYTSDFIIGGTNPNALEDDQGPLVEVFMNNDEFVFGGITDENPTLYVKLSDDNGINVVGSSIGHDLTGILDQNTQNTYLLNDFYESALDDYTEGVVRYPLFNVPEGRHNIKVKAWDVANNSSEGYTEFVVASDAEVALKHVLNYPNPFTNCTYFQLEHNLPDQLIDVQVRIFTVSGKLVKTIEEQVPSSGYRLTDQVKWDGTDDYGDRLARGVYLYKVKLGAAESGNTSLNAESDFEKLVILK